MSTPTNPMFDLQDVIDLLAKASELALRLDTLEVPAEDGRSIRKGDPEVAAANRDIQYLMHLCERAIAETAAVYWASRGYPDPLGAR